MAGEWCDVCGERVAPLYGDWQGIPVFLCEQHREESGLRECQGCNELFNPSEEGASAGSCPKCANAEAYFARMAAEDAERDARMWEGLSAGRYASWFYYDQEHLQKFMALPKPEQLTVLQRCRAVEELQSASRALGRVVGEQQDELHRRINALLGIEPEDVPF